MTPGAGSAIGGIAGVVGAVAGGIGAGRRQKKMLEYAKEVQEKTWTREDQAMQRRVADLKAAGLSPTLATGQGAATSQPTAGMMAAEAAGGKAAAVPEAISKVANQQFASTYLDNAIKNEKLNQEKHITNAMNQPTYSTETIIQPDGTVEMYVEPTGIPLGEFAQGMQLRREQLQNENTRLENRLKAEGVTRSEIDTAWKIIQRDHPQINPVMQEYLVNQMVLESNRLGVQLQRMNVRFYDEVLGMSPAGFGAITGAAHKAIGLGAGFLTGGFAGSMGR